MASKNVTSAASSQYMLEVHMSTIYHKGGISLAQPSPLYSVRNEIVLAPKKAMAPFLYYIVHISKANFSTNLLYQPNTNCSLYVHSSYIPFFVNVVKSKEFSCTMKEINGNFFADLQNTTVPIQVGEK